MNASDAAAPRPSALLIVTTLAVLMGLQPATTDLYLPALPALKADLGSSMASAQLTLSALLLSFGMVQLLMGPLSDRLGRRPVLLGGLVLYALATLASIVAPNIGVLIACRALQGVGMAATVVCARAMVRDLYEPHEGARVMARALTGLGVVALASPLIGAIVVNLWSWRMTFVACTLYAAGALLLVLRRLPETLQQPNPAALQWAPLMKAWRRIGTHPGFITWTLLTSFTYGAIYTFLAGSSFLYINIMGVSRLGYGLAVSGVTLVYVAGTLVCHRNLPRLGIQRTVQRAATFSLAGGLALAVLAISGWHTPWTVTAACMCISFGHAHHQSCGQAALPAPFPQHAGTASALAGFVSSALAFGIGAWLGLVLDNRAAPLLLTQASMAVLAAAVGWSLVPRHGHVLAKATPAAQG